MAENVTVLKCFIASPNDMREIRMAAAEAISEINRRIGETLKIRIEPVMGETDAIPSAGAYPQAVINEQLKPDACDYFVLILGGRVGMPTGVSISGSIEEFNLAYDAWKATKGNRILVYFQKNISFDIDNVDTAQIDSVKRIKQQVKDANCLYDEFMDKSDFIKRFTYAMEKTVMEGFCGKESDCEHDVVRAQLQKALDESLSLFSNQPITWVDRRLCEEDQMPQSLSDTMESFDAAKIIEDKDSSCIIKSPPQGGLTSLGHYLVLKAWEVGQKWLYVDSDVVKARKLQAVVHDACETLKCDKLSCVVLDSWSADKPGAQKILEALEVACPNVRLIVLETSAESLDIMKSCSYKLSRPLKKFHLLPLTKMDVRKVVSVYGSRIEYDETTVLNKIMSDIEVLNIHRTPMNCWTLLTVAEQNFQETPINRAQLLDQVLFVLFSIRDIPTYSARPDVKDCEHLLGAFCDWVIRNQRYEFSEAEFFEKAKAYCDEYYVELDCRWLYEILRKNKILVRTFDGDVRFGALFWVYYFAAKRMRYNEEFRNYILAEERYSMFPEIIEFYTGDSRGESGMLKILCDDLDITVGIMAKKLGVEKPLNPLKHLKWSGSDLDAEKAKKRLHDFVQDSDVPDYIKDQHSDATYNYLKPYDQSVEHYVEGASFHKFSQQLSALSRALRNSDFADSGVRKLAMTKVIQGWLEVAKVLFVLSPALAARGRMPFSDTIFCLGTGFEKITDTKEKFMALLTAIPMNVIRSTSDDIASQRNGRLFYAMLDSQIGELARHLIILYLINERPTGWDKRVRSYIREIPSRSFYQDDVIHALRLAIKYGYYDARTGVTMKNLLLESGSIFYNKAVARMSSDFVPKSQIGCDEISDKKQV